MKSGVISIRRIFIIVSVLVFSIHLAAAANVSISGFQFLPNTINVSAGTTVTWTNNDPAGHTVTSNAGLFDSGIFSQGQSYSHTFNTTGNFDYLCSVHPFMTGTVIVEQAAISPITDPDVARYDANHDGVIQKIEAVQAVVDYFSNVITKAQAVKVVVAYFSAPPG